MSTMSTPSDEIDNSDIGDQNATLGISGFVIILAIVSVILRFYTRITTKTGLKLDDWMIMASMVTTVITAVLLLWGKQSPEQQRVDLTDWFR
jgi:hypothetical protein